MNTPQVLVTGGTGVLGRRVVERLGSEGIRARVFSRSGRPCTIRGDLLTGEGLEPAVQGVDTIIHCASSPFRKARQVDVEGTGRLLEVAAEAGVSHLAYISIVGIDRATSYPYYRIKLETERVVEAAPVPHTILRATQFYDLVLMVMRFLDRLPLMVVPRGFLGQPIDAGEVAGRLVELALRARGTCPRHRRTRGEHPGRRSPRLLAGEGKQAEDLRVCSTWEDGARVP
jgi:uncharacterized protein YbjT (DUF2867 family)